MLHTSLLAVLACCLFSSVCAQDSCTPIGCSSECGEGAPAPPPPWIGDLMTRSAVTGDWGGMRSSLAENGFTFSGNATQFYPGVVHGGTQNGFEYGGHNDYVLDVDMDKAAGCKGSFLKFRAEHHYGDSVNQRTGAVLPATLASGLPVVDSEKLYLTNLLISQFFSESFGVYFGKLDTLDGDRNAFAHGRGKTQFLNTSLAANPALLRVVPYSTLGAGALFVLGPESIINVGVVNPTDTANRSGLSELFRDGAVITAEGRFETDFFGKPGHQLVGGAWSSKDYVSLQQDPRILFPPLGIPIVRQSGSWAAYYNFDQYLVMDPCDSSRGCGVFGRFGISDGNPNPIEWFLSFGVGGNSRIRGHEADTWGLGWYMNGISDELGAAATAFLGLDNSQGVECFYNYEVTPWFHLTTDVQYIQPSAQNRASEAVVLAFRAKIDL
jgi:porin